MKDSELMIQLFAVIAAVFSAIAVIGSLITVKKANEISLRQVELQKLEHQPIFRITILERRR